jgi:hypothetical protein
MGWSRGKRKRTPVLGVVVFRDQVLGCCREGNGGERISIHTLPEGHLFLDLVGPDQVQKIANSGTCFENTRIMRLFPENTADYRFKMYANRRDWRADRGWDRPELLIREHYTAIGGGGFEFGYHEKKGNVVIYYYKRHLFVSINGQAGYSFATILWNFRFFLS